MSKKNLRHLLEDVEEESVEDYDTIDEEEADPEVADEEAFNDEMGYVDEETQNSDNAIEPPVSDSSTVLEKEKKKHLFKLSNKLFDYGRVMKDNMEFIDFSLLDGDVVMKVKDLGRDIESFLAKVESFVSDIFVKETYEKNLYIYLTLREEILSIVKIFRILLDLRTNDETKPN